MAEIFSFDPNIKKALIIVAHADDETIFMGGTILKNKNWEWKVFILAYRNKETDNKQVENVLEEYKKIGVENIKLCELSMQLPSTQNDGCVKLQENDAKNFINNIKNISPDIIFTHNQEGEYGHPQHKLVNRCVREIFKDYCIWEFIAPCATNVVPQPFKENTIIIKLGQDELKNKREIYSLYKSEQGNWINDLSKTMLYQFGSGPEIFTK